MFVLTAAAALFALDLRLRLDNGGGRVFLLSAGAGSPRPIGLVSQLLEHLILAGTNTLQGYLQSWIALVRVSHLLLLLGVHTPFAVR